MNSQPSTTNSTKCKFCGAALMPLTFNVGGHDYTVGHKACKCKEAQRAIKAEQEAEREAERQAAQAKLERKIEASGIPIRYRHAKTDRDDLIKAAQESGLYIQGAVGVGKTDLACAIGLRLIERGVTVLFVKASDLVDMMSQFADNIEAIDAIKAPDVLIIDDIGMSENRDWTDKRLRRAIDARWDSCKPVIVTSNYSKKDLYASLAKSDAVNADAIMSRLIGMTQSVTISGEDRRFS